MQQYYMNPQFLLKLGPSLVMVLFGLNQLLRPNYWLQYVPDWATRFMSPYTIMNIHGLINVALGLLLFSGWNASTVICLTLLWFLSILPFAYSVDWTIGLRDTSIILSLLALFYLSKK